MTSFGRGTHFEGPLLGSHRATNGLFEGLPLGVVDHHRSPFLCFYDDLTYINSIAGAEAAGWTETAVGTAASRSVAYSVRLRALEINADTVADEGSNLQYNAAPTTGIRGRLLPPIASTANLMNAKELIWSSRISFLVGNGSTFDSKALFGWFVTNTGLMTAATGALNIGTGGGIGFHVSGDAGGTSTGSLDCVCQAISTPVSVPSGVVISTAGTAFATVGWIDVGFRARWRGGTGDPHVGRGDVKYYVNGRHVATIVDNMPMQSTQTYSNSIEVINGPATADQVDMGVESIFNGITRIGFDFPYTTPSNI